jgi:hypothetical protein
VAVQHTQTPCTQDQQSSSREKNADQANGEATLFAFEAGRDQIDKQRSSGDTSEDQDGASQAQDSENRGGKMAGLGVLSTRAQLRIDGDKGRGKDTFSEQVIQQIWNSDGLAKGVGHNGIYAKVIANSAFPG